MKISKYVFFLCVFLSYLPVLAQVDTAWVRRYNGGIDDGARALTVDQDRNVYVTGFSRGGSSYEDYVTIKYAPNGDTLWLRRYNGPGDYLDVAIALVVDKTGNVYVTGKSGRIGGPYPNYDYGTIKYAPNGDTLWVRQYNGPGNDDDEPFALAVDDSGNVYVTGTSIGVGTYYDCATIKYSPTGDVLWVSRYNGPGNYYDEGRALAVDQSGNVCVTGRTATLGYNINDYVTIKYSSSGDTLWVRPYNGPENGSDAAYSLEIDDSGNVYVTGHSSGGDKTYLDYATIKYSPSGDTLWVRRYDGPVNDYDAPRALAVDQLGNVYVTGQSTGAGTFYDYTTIKYSPSGDTLWVRRYNGPGNGVDIPWALAVDNSGNVYLSGYSSNGTDVDFRTIKYDKEGNILWTKRYDGPMNDNDYVFSLVVDDSGNVYIAGESWNIPQSGDYAIIKYIPVECTAIAGDASGDNKVNIADIVFKVNYVFKGGPEPNPLCLGDDNADGSVNLQDIIYSVNYIFKGGPAPLKSRECCL